jgi:hypothetical protein
MSRVRVQEKESQIGIRDLGSGMENNWTRDKNSGSATLHTIIPQIIMASELISLPHTCKETRTVDYGKDHSRPAHLTDFLLSPSPGYLFMLKSKVADPDPDPNWIRIQSSQWIRIRIQEGKNYPQK